MQVYISNLKYLTDFHETWFAQYASGGYRNTGLPNSLQSVITTWLTRKF